MGCITILIEAYLVMQMDAKLPIDTFETVMQLATEGCKAIANYIREVSFHSSPSLIF